MAPARSSVHPAPMTFHRPTRRHAVLALMAGATLAALLPAPGLGGVTTPYAAVRSRVVAPGIVHEQGTMRTAGSRIQAVQVARADLSVPSVRLRALLSNDRVVGLERPSELAERKSSAAALAVVATNGDVSVRGETGALAAPHSMHVADGEVMVAVECARPTLGVDADGGARIGNVRIRTRVDIGRTIPGTWRSEIQVKGVNTDRRTDEAILYTPRFGARTLTRGAGSEAVLVAEGTLTPWGELTATVLEVRPGGSSTWIGPGRFVLSGSGRVAREVELLAPGDRVTIRTVVLAAGRSDCGPDATEAPAWRGIVEALGGNHFVTRDGRVAAPSAREDPDGAIPAPRTCVGLDAEGNLVLAVVDGRQPGYSVGVTLAEMGRLLADLGAVSAFNLDGGGSSVIAVRRAGAAHITVSNRPSDGSERRLTQALGLFHLATDTP